MNRSERLENLSAYIDGELSDAEQRLLSAWLDNHPEDVTDFEGVADVVRVVRTLPEVEPPAGLRECILAAVADASPVEASRDQVLEWLDKYFDGELPEPQRQVVEHYLAVDAEFQQTAAVHQAMLRALSEMDEAEPPADLRRKIEEQVGLAPASPRRGRAVVSRPYLPRRRVGRLVLAVAAVLAMALGLSRLFRDDTPRTQTAVQPVPPAGAPAAVASGPVAEPEAPAGALAEVPVDDAAEPVVPGAMAPDAPVGPAPRHAPPAAEVGGARRADRDKRTPAQPVAPRGTAPRPRTVTPTVPKSSPGSRPADLRPGSVGNLASDGSSSVGVDQPEIISRSGSGSVLGEDDNKVGGTGNSGRGVEGSDAGGGVDPTRRIDAPPF